MKFLLALLAIVVCSNHVSFADSTTIFDVNRPIGDQVGDVSIGHQYIIGNSGIGVPIDNRMLVEVQFYGIQKDGKPNEKSRWFWLQAQVASNPADLAQGKGEPKAFQINLIPYTRSNTDLPKYSYGYVDREESHHQWGAMQFSKDSTLGMRWGFRIRPYTYANIGNEGPIMHYYSADVLGYDVEGLKTLESKNAIQNYLHVGAFNGGISLVAFNTERTRLLVDLLRAGVSVNIPLGGNPNAPAHVLRANIEGGARFQIFRSNLRSLLGEINVHAGDLANTVPARDDNVRYNPDNYGYVNTSLVLYFE